MNIKSLSISFFQMCLISFNLFADDCVPSIKDSTIKEIVKIADYLGEETNKFKEYKKCELAFNESCVSRWGTLYDKSCFPNVKNKSDFDKIFNNFDDIILKMHNQSNKCAEYIGFKRDIHSVLPILRRTHLKCPSGDSLNYIMSAETTRYDSSISKNNLIRASFDGKFVININKKYINEETNYETASTIFHEVLHFLKLNNFSSKIHSKPTYGEGCSSFYMKDTVYFMSGACFPNSSIGRHLYDENKLYECKSECINTLTRNFNDDRYAQAGSEWLMNRTIGQQSTLLPYNIDEAKLACENIYTLKKNYNKLQEQLNIIENKKYKIHNFNILAAFNGIDTLISALSSRKISLSETEAKLSKFESEAIADTKKYCLSNNTADNSLICDNDNLAFKEIVKSYRQFIKNLKNDRFYKLSE